jgi:hypothetical protein
MAARSGTWDGPTAPDGPAGEARRGFGRCALGARFLATTGRRPETPEASGAVAEDVSGFDQGYASNFLLEPAPPPAGGFFNFFSFTTASNRDLLSLSFEAGNNDIPNGPRDFDILLSPVDAAAPATGDGAGTLGTYSLLDTVAVPFGFAGAGPTLNVDLTGTSLTAGTYHFAFALSDPGQIDVTGTQLFLDEVQLTAVPEPTTGLLFATGLAALAARQRRLH